MLIVGFRGTGNQSLYVDLPDITQRNIRGVILFDYDVPSQSTRNIVSVEQTKKLLRELQSLGRGRLFIALDQKGIAVKNSMGFLLRCLPGFLGANDQSEEDIGMGTTHGTNLATDGLQREFCPIGRCECDPDNPIIGALETQLFS